MRVKVLIGVLLLLPTLALACLNDRETVNTENEFRSRYESPANPGAGAESANSRNSQALPSTSEWSPVGIAIAAVGILMITSATKIASRKLARPENKP